MPREAARIKAAIWSDRDFTALPLDAQWLYLTLLSQPSLNLAGVLTIPRRMWANLVADEDSSDRIAHAWKVLEDRRYVVSDDDTDELLVRSFIRNDIEYGAPGPFVAAMAAAAAVQSPRLRTVLLGELQRLDSDRLAEKKPARHGERPYEVWQRTVADLGRNAMSDGPGDGMNSSTVHAMKTADVHAMPNAIGAGVGVGIGSSVGNGVTSVGAADADAATTEETSVEEPTPPRKRPTKRGTRIPNDFRVTDDMKAWLARDCPDVDGPRETQAFVDYWRAESTQKGVKADWPATWRNWMRREQKQIEQRARSRFGSPPRSDNDPATTGRRRVQC